jgi:hypothetical protein
LPTVNSSASKTILIAFAVVFFAIIGCVVSPLLTTGSGGFGNDFLPFLVFIPFFLIFNGIFGAIAGSIARKKGHSYGTYFMLAFFFNMIGLIIAIMLPDRSGFGATPAQPAPEESNGPIIQSTDVVIDAGALTASWHSPETWQCQYCAQVNDKNNTNCTKCGASRPQR